MDNIKELLSEEIQSELETLKDIEIGSDKYKTAVDGIVKLTDRAIEFKKVEADAHEKEEARKLEQKKLEVNSEEKSKDRDIELKKLDANSSEKSKDREQDATLKREQMKDNKRDNVLKNGIAILGIVLPLGITVWGTIKSLRFEQEGTVTTMVGRGFINKLIPKK